MSSKVKDASLLEYHQNLIDGIMYYRQLASQLIEENETEQKRFLSQIGEAEEKVRAIVDKARKLFQE